LNKTFLSNKSNSSQLQASGTGTYFGVSDRTNMTNSNLSVNNESRWSKLREDQAAKLFEKRYNFWILRLNKSFKKKQYIQRSQKTQ